MPDTLFLSLREPGPDGRRVYALAGADHPGSLSVDRGDPDAVLALAVRRRIVLFAPADDVRLATINVPARQAQKVLQAAPYALEDQLAEDVETLHFAIGERQPDGSHPVAVISRARLDSWLAPLSARGLVPEAVLPETLCLPVPAEGEWTGVAEARPTGAPRLVVRTGACSGFTCTLDELDSFLPLADPEGKVRLTLYVTDGVDADFTRLGRAVDLRPGHRSLIEVLARFRTAESINLLQGPYAHAQGWAARLQPWKTAAILLAAWVTLALSNSGLQAWKTGRELADQDARNLARFQGLYPAETRIIDLAAQTGQKLTAARSGNQQAPWFELLEVLSQALVASPGLSLRSLQFREGAFYLQLTGSDLQAFESMRQWFESRREARISDVQANSGTDGVQVRFKLERGS